MGYASRPMNTLPATTPGQAAKLPPCLLLRDISADLAYHRKGGQSLTSWYRLCTRQSFRQLPPQPSRRGKSSIARFGGENGLGAQGKTHGQCHTHHTIFHRVILSEIRSGRFSALSVTRRRAVGRHHASGKTNNVVAIGCGRIQVGISMVALAGPQPQG